MTRRFPTPWIVEPIPGGFKIRDATGQALAYVYARGNEASAQAAKVLTMDEARRIAANIAKLPEILAVAQGSSLEAREQLQKWQRDLEDAENALQYLEGIETAELDRIEWKSRAAQARRKIAEEKKRLSASGLGDIEDE